MSPLLTLLGGDITRPLLRPCPASADYLQETHSHCQLGQAKPRGPWAGTASRKTSCLGGVPSPPMSPHPLLAPRAALCPLASSSFPALRDSRSLTVTLSKIQPLCLGLLLPCQLRGFEGPSWRPTLVGPSVLRTAPKPANLSSGLGGLPSTMAHPIYPSASPRRPTLPSTQKLPIHLGCLFPIPPLLAPSLLVAAPSWPRAPGAICSPPFPPPAWHG